MNTSKQIIMVLGLSTIAALAGCSGLGQQSKHTNEGMKLAQAKINGIKAGVEWETAERQFLAGDLDKALRTCERAIIMNPNVVKSHVLKGRILMERGNFELAIDSFRQAATLAPDNIDAQYFQGIIAERQARYDEALMRYTKAMELDPTDAQHVIAAAEMCIQLGQMEKGETLLREKASLFNANAGIRHALGQMEMIRNRFDTACEQFNQARLLAPDDLVILEDLTRAQIAARKYGEAEFNLQMLLKAPQNADRTDLQILQVRCLAAMDRLVDARTIMGNVVMNAKHGNDLSAWIMYGNICARLEDPIRLRQSVSRILQLAPDRPEGYALRSMLMRMTNQPQAALTAINTAISINPNDPEQWVIRGLIQAEAGEYSDSQRSLRSALKLDPQNGNANQLMTVVAALSQPAPNTAAVSGQ